MKVLVTGGLGFIGRAVCATLLNKGNAVRVLDNQSQARWEDFPLRESVEFIDADIRSFADCRKAAVGVEGVVHLAAMSKVLPSLKGPEMMSYCMEHNLNGTENVLRAALEADVTRFIYAGSSTVYGLLPTPHRETLLPDCQTPYALSKYFGEQTALLYCRLYGLPVLSLRFFQVCGPGQPSTGEYAVVAGIFCRQREAGVPLTVHGDGSQRRDFVHVRDVAEAVSRALETDRSGLAINIGRGESFSVKELADRISPLQSVGLPERANDLRETVAALERCQEVLDWVPSIGFDQMINEMLSESSGGEKPRR